MTHKIPIYLIHTDKDHIRILENGMNELVFPDLTKLVLECIEDTDAKALCFLEPQYRIDLAEDESRMNHSRFLWSHRESGEDFSYRYLPDIRGHKSFAGIVSWDDGKSYKEFARVLEGVHPGIKQMNADEPVGVLINFAKHSGLVSLLGCLGYDVKQRTLFTGDGWRVEKCP